MSIFNFLQHLFTVRAIERELANEKAQKASLEERLAACRADNENLKHDLEICRQKAAPKPNAPPPIGGWAR